VFVSPAFPFIKCKWNSWYCSVTVVYYDCKLWLSVSVSMMLHNDVESMFDVWVSFSWSVKFLWNWFCLVCFWRSVMVWILWNLMLPFFPSVQLINQAVRLLYGKVWRVNVSKQLNLLLRWSFSPARNSWYFTRNSVKMLRMVNKPLKQKWRN